MAHGNRRRLLVLAIAGGGVLLGHWLTYLLDVPDPAARDAVLRASGHGYFGIAGELASALLALSIVTVFLGALVDRDGRRASTRGLTTRLVLLQAGAFAGMEIVERVVAGAPLWDLARGWILPAGLLVNAAVAMGGAALFRWILQTADHVATAAFGPGIDPALHRSSVALVPVPSPPRRRHAALTAALVRGPPLPACR